MTVNEELKETAIKEYLEEKEKRVYKSVNDGVKLAVLIMASIYFIIFAVKAVMYYIMGRYADGAEISSLGISVSALFLLPACLFVWILMRKRAAADRARAEEELRKTSYTIEDDSLVRKIEGDGRRTKRYRLEQISNVSKDGAVVTLEYGASETEILDFYEPSLYDCLKKEILVNGKERT